MAIVVRVEKDEGAILLRGKFPAIEIKTFPKDSAMYVSEKIPLPWLLGKL